MNKDIEIPANVQDALKQAGQAYADSEATTAAGKWLRFFLRFVSLDVIAKALAHKIGK